MKKKGVTPCTTAAIVVLAAVCIFNWCSVLAWGYSSQKSQNAPLLTNKGSRLTSTLYDNGKCVDLTDIKGSLPLRVNNTKRILERNEEWEYRKWDMQNDRDSVGYPSVVKNTHGSSPDNKYYLFYSHHNSNAGIGCAVAKTIEGPYIKIAELDSRRKDSRVLVSPGKPGDPFHYSSPCVVWNEEQNLWVMYFHYYKDEFKEGKGHQKTGLATCRNLSANEWTIYRDRKGEIIPVLPTTKERWMNSQSSYHAIQRLANGKWLAFLRGTGGEYRLSFDRHRGARRLGLYRAWIQDTTKLGFAFSSDGVHWDYLPENPIIRQTVTEKSRLGVYRPHFVGYLGNGVYLLCWSESQYYDADPKAVCGTTTDFLNIKRDSRGYAAWDVYDGLVSPWREGDKLYLFTGKYLHIIKLRVRKGHRS